MICLVTAQVLGTSPPLLRFAWRVTLTISKGLTRMASNTPAPKPASENVWKLKDYLLMSKWWWKKEVNSPKVLACRDRKGRKAWAVQMSRTWQLVSVSLPLWAEWFLCKEQIFLQILSFFLHNRKHRCNKPKIDLLNWMHSMGGLFYLKNLTLLPVCADKFTVLICNCNLVLIKSNGCIMQTSMNPLINSE